MGGPSLADIQNLGVVDPLRNQQLAAQGQFNQAQAQEPPPDTQQLEDLAQQGQQRLGQQLQVPQQPPPVEPSSHRGGIVKSLLTNFFSGAGEAMMKYAGVETPQQYQQRMFTQNIQKQNADSLAALRQMQEEAAGGAEITPEMAQAVPDLAPMVGQKAPKQFVDLIGKAITAKIGAKAKVDVANINAGGIGVPVDHTTAILAEMPELEGKLLGKQGWDVINKALTAKGYKIQDMAANGTEPHQGMWVVDRLGKPINQVSPHSVALARGAGFALSRAMYTPFDTVMPGTNQPTTISNLQALQTGAPHVNVATAQKIGGVWALYNDAYGLMDQADQYVRQIDLSDSATRARLTAGYSALREPAAKGLMGEFLSNYLARQPINAQLSEAERGLLLTMANAKAAGTGMRSIIGQAGTNEMQQVLDSSLMPGSAALASPEAFMQQTQNMRKFLDRFAAGQVQVGLNAPGAATALSNKGKGEGGGKRIRVRRKSDGRMGDISESQFDASKYDRQ